MEATVPPPGARRGTRVVSPHGAARLRRAAHRLVDSWLPRACALCGGALAASAPGACEACVAELPGRAVRRCPACAMPSSSDACCAACAAEPPPWEAAVVVADYAPPLDRLVLALKFGGELAAGRALGGLLAAAFVARCAGSNGARVARPAPGAFALPDLVVPVPLSAPRLVERGYNQAQAIAVAAARRLGLPVAARALERLRDTPAQSALALDARRANLHGAMRAGPAVAGRRVALVDDVMTTGATARAAACALSAAGARSVLVLAVARTA